MANRYLEGVKVTKLAGDHPGLVKPGNIDLIHRPVVANPEGGTSTVFSMSFGTPEGEILIPRVSMDGRLMSEDEAIKEYYKTKQHLGIFKTPADADRYGQLVHQQQEALGNSAFYRGTPQGTPTMQPLQPPPGSVSLSKGVSRGSR